MYLSSWVPVFQEQVHQHCQFRCECLRQPITNITLLKILESLVSLKVLVLGEAGVGKSSLMLRFVAFLSSSIDPSRNTPKEY